MNNVKNCDLVVSEISTPINYWCRSGHISSKLFKREGAQGKSYPIKFFKITFKKQSVLNGVYCEPCIIIINWLANQKRKSHGTRNSAYSIKI